jgi:GntR family transcriptional regulator, phosphonate transport system regulatory protein
MAGQTRQSATTAWGRIAADLAGAITKGDYAPGDALPTALDLAGQYGVHRHTARQALRHLQEEGLVSVEPGRGSFVTGQRFPYPLGSKVSFRNNLAAVGRQASGRVIDTVLAKAPSAVVRALQGDATQFFWRIRTIAFADSIPVNLAVHWFDSTRFPTVDAAIQKRQGAVSKALADMGITHYNRRSTTISARLATSDERRHLALAKGAPVLTSYGIDILPDGTQFHAVESIFAPDRIEFVVEGDADLSKPHERQ